MLLVIVIVQFVVSCAAAILFGIVPSGCMFGNHVGSKSRKYLSDVHGEELERNARIALVFLWVLIFSCKFVESYFFLTLSFQESVRVMVGTKVQGCEDRFFGNPLCSNQPAFTLTIMFIGRSFTLWRELSHSRRSGSGCPRQLSLRLPSSRVGP